jgi:hypothetical protein
MELAYLLLTGSLSGLVSILGHSVFWSAAELVRPPPRETYADLPILDVVLHMLCGIGLGFMFWLSWGLAAIGDVPWWQRGLSFGGLCIVALVLPLTISAVASRRLERGQAVAMTARWVTTCLITGLACAWSWARRM